ncbi:MAG: hypothetical protein M1829_002945 [Trizodia sp. TS-e1964]|nr:MAG: hypothetical protein M1829_002945 [Trizodia sp. TS-e1964]
MLYELIAVVRPGNLREVKEIARTMGTQILASQGVVRGITNWGTSLLPKRTRKHQATYDHGHYFLMRFDCSVEAQNRLRRTLGLDPRMVKFSVVRMADGLATRRGIESVAGQAQWSRRVSSSTLLAQILDMSNRGGKVGPSAVAGLSAGG